MKRYGIEVTRFGKSAVMKLRFENIYDAIDALEFYRSNSTRFTKYRLVEFKY